jgi:hypothetical protein
MVRSHGEVVLRSTLHFGCVYSRAHPEAVNRTQYRLVGPQGLLSRPKKNYLHMYVS